MSTPVTTILPKVKLEPGATTNIFNNTKFISSENVKFKRESTPKLTHIDAKHFSDWKLSFRGLCISLGVVDVLELNPTTLVTLYTKELSNKIIGNNQESFNEKILKLAQNHCIQVYAGIVAAIENGPAMKLVHELENIQRNKPNEFISNNGYFLWKMLLEKYEDRTAIGRIGFILRLFKGEYKFGSDPDGIRSYIEGIEHSLMACGGLPGLNGLPEIFKIAALVNSLPSPQLDVVRTMIGAKDNITFDEAFALLKNVYDQNKEIAGLNATPARGRGNIPPSESAHALTDRSKANDNRSTQNKGKNNKENSIANDCKKHPFVRSEGSKHTWKECSYNPDNKSSDKGKSSKATPGRDSPEFNALTYEVETKQPRKTPRVFFPPEAKEEVNAVSPDGTITDTINEFLFDTACSKHTGGDPKIFESEPKALVSPIQLNCYNDKKVIINKAGPIRLTSRLRLHDVGLGPKGSKNLISGAKIVDAGLIPVMHKDQIGIYKKEQVKVTGTPVITFKRQGNLFVYTKPSASEESKPGLEIIPVARGQIPRVWDTEQKSSDNSSSSVARETLINSRSVREAAAKANQANVAVEIREEYAYGLFDETKVSGDTSGKTTDSETLWHSRFGHTSINALIKANEKYKLRLSNTKLREAERTEGGVCTHCVAGKGRRSQISHYGDQNWQAKCIMDRFMADTSGRVSIRNAKGKKIPLYSLGGNLYALHVIDEYSRYAWTFLLQNKSEATEKITSLIKRIQTLTGKKLKVFHSDGGGEFVNGVMEVFLKENGTTFTTTNPDTPQHNHIPERFGQTIFSMARSLLHESGLPQEFWGFAVETATYIYNHTPNSAIDYKTPQELLLGYDEGINKLRVFGCTALAFVPMKYRGKLESKFKRCIFVGYNEERRAWLLYEASTGKTFSSRDVKFIENSYEEALKLNYTSETQTGTAGTTGPSPNYIDYSDNESDDESEHEEDSITNTTSNSQSNYNFNKSYSHTTPNPYSALDDDSQEEKYNDLDLYSNDIPTLEPDSDTELKEEDKAERQQVDTVNKAPVILDNLIKAPVVTRSGRVSKPTIISSKDYIDKKLAKSLQINYAHSNSNTNGICNTYENARMPKTISEAMLVDPTNWGPSIDKEKQSIIDQKVYMEIDPDSLPAGKTPIPSMTVFKIKQKSDGSIGSYKTRIVAKGCRQQYGIDYEEVYAPVVKYDSLRLFLALIAKFDLELHQIDFICAFLNATLHEEVYVTPPTGYYPEKNKKVIWKLLKALYGLKQSPMEWNDELDSYLRSLGYKPTRSDKCIYIKKSKTGKPIILCLYVDDTTAGFHKADEEEWLSDKQALNEKFPLTDLGECKWLLNMEITRDRTQGKLWLTQSAYIKKMLERYGMNNCNSLNNPGTDLKLLEINEKSIMLDYNGINDYQSIVGTLSYASHTTRPDIAYMISILSRNLKNPSVQHMNAAKRVMRYLSGTINEGLLFTNDKREGVPLFEAYSDASWASNLENRRSTTGFMVKYNGTPISWRSQRQPTASLSTAEAEYLAITEVLKDILWYRKIVKEIFNQTISIPIYSDSTAAIAAAKRDGNERKLKHIDIRYHFIKEHLHNGVTTLNWISTNDQQADIFTKALPSKQFNYLKNSIIHRL